jgi:hypothetical protein
VFRRRVVRKSRRLVRDELNESLEHLRMAAAYAAGGAAGVLAPKIGDAQKAARKAATESIDSLVDVARDGARQAGTVARRGSAKMRRKKPSMARRRWPTMVSGLVLVGGVTAAGAMIRRRRARQRQWDEYGTVHPHGGIKESAKSAMESGRSKASEMLGTAAEKVSPDGPTIPESTPGGGRPM